MQELNDKEFIARLRSGDETAYSYLHRKLRPIICDFVINFFEIERGLAEEVAADALLKVHHAVKTFNPNQGAKLTTWVFKIAKNQVLDYFRKKSKSVDGLLLDTDTLLHIDKESVQALYREVNQKADCGPANKSDGENEYLLRKKALDSLSEGDRSILRMRIIMSNQEIAEVENVAAGAIRTRHFRARERLHIAFERERKIYEQRED